MFVDFLFADISSKELETLLFSEERQVDGLTVAQKAEVAEAGGDEHRSASTGEQARGSLIVDIVEDQQTTLLSAVAIQFVHDDIQLALKLEAELKGQLSGYLD